MKLLRFAANYIAD